MAWQPPEQLFQLNAGMGLVGTVLEQLAEQVKCVTDKTHELAELVARKVESAALEEMRRKVESLEQALASKAELAEVEQVNTHLQTLNNTVARKAEHTRLEQLEVQIQTFGPILSRKAETARLDELTSRVNALGDVVKRLSEYPVADQLKHEMRLLADTVACKADVASLDQLSSQVHALSTAVALKAEIAVVDRLAAQHQGFHNALQQKAEATDLQTAQRGVHRLSEQLQAMQDVAVAGAEMAALSRTLEHKAASVGMVELGARLFGQDGETLSHTMPALGGLHSPGRLGVSLSAISSAPLRSLSGAPRQNRLKQWSPNL